MKSIKSIFKLDMLGFCVVVGMLVGLSGIAQADVYRCQVEGVMLFTDQYCGPTAQKLPMPVLATRGISLATSKLKNTSQTLGVGRKARELSAQLTQARKAMTQMTLAYQREQEALANALMSLPESPQYRNWKTNASREEKLKAHQITLRARIKEQAKDYQVSRGLISDKIRLLQDELSQKN